MTSRPTKRGILNSSLGPPAVGARRLQIALSHSARELRQATHWYFHSREYTNFTYPLSGLNRTQLAWWVAEVTGTPLQQIRGYFCELETDRAIANHVRVRTRQAAWGRYSDEDVHFGRRLGWYAIARALKPAMIVETGTDKGLGSIVMAAAVLRSGLGQVVTIDLNDDTGYLIGAPYDAVVERRIGDSVEVIKKLGTGVEMFVHDSLHTREHEVAELGAVERWLTPNAVVLSDNAHVTDALADWAEATDRTFSYFQEIPAAHWYRGAGIGLARRRIPT